MVIFYSSQFVFHVIECINILGTVKKYGQIFKKLILGQASVQKEQKKKKNIHELKL